MSGTQETLEVVPNGDFALFLSQRCLWVLWPVGLPWQGWLWPLQRCEGPREPTWSHGLSFPDCPPSSLPVTSSESEPCPPPPPPSALPAGPPRPACLNLPDCAAGPGRAPRVPPWDCGSGSRLQECRPGAVCTCGAGLSEACGSSRRDGCLPRAAVRGQVCGCNLAPLAFAFAFVIAGLPGARILPRL